MGLTINPAQTLQAERLSYPGMLPRECLIYKNWLAVYGGRYDNFDYNSRIGPGYDPGPAWPEEMRRMAIANSQKRIDVVAWSGLIPTLIEVKDRAGASAIGQLMTYFPLWNADHPDLTRCSMMLVSNRAQPGIDVACKYHGVELVLVPTDFSILARDRRASPFMAKSTSGIVVL